jgi:L-rhamnose isomerase
MSIFDFLKKQTVYDFARERYAHYGVDTEKAMERLAAVSISLQCWQGDDVTGFEGTKGDMGGCIATGTYPGRARTADELRADLDEVYKLLPGRHRLSPHASYLETGGEKVERNEIEPRHFQRWIDWAKQNKIGLDFNQTFFAHPKAAGGFTLASYDDAIRRFWIEHAIACRKIGEYMGKAQGTPCVTNLWIPDGFKDTPVDRNKSRELLKDSLDEIFAVKFDKKFLLDSLEPKLFGIGVESCTVGSHEFYLGYAIKNNLLLCLDTGHYHPTESVADKISAVLLFLDRIMLHISRPVRWDSDHVVILSDELQDLAKELVRGDFLGRVHIGLDYFDASINRIAAWVTGARCAIKSLLIAMLEPTEMLRKFEINGDCTSRLVMLEELKTLPFGTVWDEYCRRMNVPIAEQWLKQVKDYESKVLNLRK